jgi:hypothetical protein
MALGIGYGLPFVAQHGTNPYKTQWAAALEGAKGAGATVEDENAGTGSCLVARGQEAYTDGLPATPSLLIVPQFYKAGNLYQDVPPFVAEDSTMRFAVSRNTTATRVNSSGLIESVASGVPRIDWLGQSCPALLVEASGQNQALWSRDLSVSGTWAASGITAVRNAVGADGAASGATTITSTAASGTITQALSHASQSRIFSAFIRRVSGSGAIQLTTNGGTNWDTVTVTTAYTQLASVARTVASGTVGIRMIASGDVIEVDYTQGEVGPVATSPIPTTTASATRAADVISASGALVSGLIGQTEGTLYAEFEYRTNTSERRLIALSNGTTSDRVMVWTLNNILYAQVEGGSLILANPITEGYHKLAFAYEQNGVSGNLFASLDGAAVVSGTSAAFPASLTDINIGKSEATATSTFFWNARIRATAIYTTRLTNDQLANITRLT